MKKILILFLLGILSANVLHAHTSAPKDVKCPMDGKKFTIYVTMSYTTFKTLKDFQKQGAIGNYYETLINSCPKCHYSGYSDDFDTTYVDAVKQDLLKILEPFKEVKINDVVECEIAALIHAYFKKKNDEIASLYLVGSFMAKDPAIAVEKRKEMQLKSIDYLLKALEAKEYEKKENSANIHYLIGELYRRTGNFENAIKYFDMALTTNKKNGIKEWAEEQKKLALNKDENNDI